MLPGFGKPASHCSEIYPVRGSCSSNCTKIVHEEVGVPAGPDLYRDGMCRLVPSGPNTGTVLKNDDNSVE